MALTKDDVRKIQNVIRAEIGSRDSKWEKRFSSFEVYIETRFNKVDQRLDRLEKKIDQLIRTEDEDMQVAFKEIQQLKSRLKKLETKVYST